VAALLGELGILLPNAELGQPVQYSELLLAQPFILLAGNAMRPRRPVSQYSSRATFAELWP
jgi:hypothetical protein